MHSNKHTHKPVPTCVTCYWAFAHHHAQPQSPETAAAAAAEAVGYTVGGRSVAQGLDSSVVPMQQAWGVLHLRPTTVLPLPVCVCVCVRVNSRSVTLIVHHLLCVMCSA